MGKNWRTLVPSLFFYSLLAITRFVHGKGCKGTGETGETQASVDLLFMIDGSWSVGADFQNQLKFVKNLVNQYGGVSQTGAHAALLVISTSPAIEFGLKKYTDGDAFEAAVSNVQYPRGATRLDIALVQAEREFAVNGRKDVPKILYILSDGVQTNDPGTGRAHLVKRIQDQGIKIIAIAVGRDIDVNALGKLTKSADDLIIPKTGAALAEAELTTSALSKACAFVEKKAGEGSALDIDLGFMVDRSSAVTQRDIIRQYTLIKYLIVEYYLAVEWLHSGIILGAEYGQAAIELGNYYNTAGFSSAVDKLTKEVGGEMRLDLALATAVNSFYTVSAGMRSNKNKAFVIFLRRLVVKFEHKAIIIKYLAQLRLLGIKIFVFYGGPSMADVDIFKNFTDTVNLQNLRGSFLVLDHPAGKVAIASHIREEMKKFAQEKLPTIGLDSKCKSMVDIGFLIDASGSSRTFFSDVIKVIHRIIDSFDVGFSKTHAGFVVFSDKARVVSAIHDGKSAEALKKELASLPTPGGATRLDIALQLTYRDLFDTAAVRDSKKPKFLFIFSDGVHASTYGIELAIKPLHVLGVQTFVMTVGMDVNIPELNKLVTKKEDVFHALTFSELRNPKFSARVSSDLCSTAEQLSRSCKVKLDIGILLDGSSSIGKNNFDELKKFLKKLIADFGVSDSATRVGLTLFSSNAKILFRLGQLIAFSQFDREVGAIRYPGGSSRLDLGLKVASTMFDSKKGGRPGIPKILFVVSDGIQSLSSGYSGIRAAITQLRSMGVLTIAASAGQRVNFGHLREIAGDKTRTFIAMSYSQLLSQGMLKAISSAACKFAPSANQLQPSKNVNWMNSFYGVWQDRGNTFYGYLPGTSNENWHFGAARVWARPVRRQKYIIETMVRPQNTVGYGACGHIWKYKLGYKSSDKTVERGWGFFLWLNRFIYATGEGTENNPRFKFRFKPGMWLNITSVVNGNLATLYVNGTKFPTVQMKGEGSTEPGDKYVGLWCHKLIYVTGMNFNVRSNEEPCRVKNGGCSQQCTDDPYEHKCSCLKGFRLAKDGVSCNDIDECVEEKAGCSETCVNLAGSYQCKCGEGQYLAADSHTCLEIPKYNYSVVVKVNNLQRKPYKLLWLEQGKEKSVDVPANTVTTKVFNYYETKKPLPVSLIVVDPVTNDVKMISGADKFTFQPALTKPEKEIVIPKEKINYQLSLRLSNVGSEDAVISLNQNGVKKAEIAAPKFTTKDQGPFFFPAFDPPPPVELKAVDSRQNPIKINGSESLNIAPTETKRVDAVTVGEVPKDYFVSLDIRNLGLKAATVVFSIDGELQQIEMPSLDIKQKELTIRSSVRPAAVRIIALDSITKSAIDINGKASIDVTPTLEKISTVVSFGEVEQVQRYLANLQISNVAATAVNLTWREDGKPKYLSVPALQNLTQPIIVKALKKPPPVIFRANDQAGDKILINGEDTLSVELTLFGTDANIKLMPATKITAAPIVETTAAPVVETTAAPVVETTAAPVAETTAASVIETTASPVAETTAAPVVETTAVPVVEITFAPVVETTAAQIVETTAAPVVETTAAPVMETTAAPVIETTAASVKTTTSSDIITKSRIKVVDSCPMAITCLSHMMLVSVKKTDLPGFNRESLMLADAMCKGGENGTHWLFGVPLNGCGTRRRYLSAAVVYSNRLKSRPVQVERGISRLKKVDVPFSCVYPTSQSVSSFGFQLKQVVPKLVKEERGFGNFQVRIDLFSDSTYSRALSGQNYPLEVEVQDRVYFEVNIDTTDPRLKVFAENCSATPTQNRNDPRRYWLIQNGCKLDETLEYHAPGFNSQRMSFEAFTFVGAEDSVAYLQCDVVICDAQDPNSRCNAGCLPSARRRRAPLIISGKNTASGNLRSGPMLVTHKKLQRPRRAIQLVDSNEEKKQLSPRVLHQSGIVVVFTGGLLLVAAVLILSVFGYRTFRKRTDNAATLL